MLRLSLLLLFALYWHAPIVSAQNAAGCNAPYTFSAGGATCQDEGYATQYKADQIAWAKAQSGSNWYHDVYGIVNEPTTYSSGNTILNWRWATVYSWTNALVAYPTGATCSSRTPPSGSGQFNAGIDGTLRCSLGCQQILSQDENSWSFTATGATCSSQNWGPSSCPSNYAWDSSFNNCTPLPPDTDGDGVPDDQDAWPFDPTRTADTDNDGIADEFDAFPSDPGENADTDGDGVGDNGDIKPSDPDNGKDGGTGNETDNVSTGGGNCSTPPNSSGDAILAQIAYQAWATRCASEGLGSKLDGIKTAIENQPTPMATAISGALGGSGGGSNIDGDVSGMSLDEGVSGITGGFPGGEGEGEGEPVEFDNAGFFGGSRTCPELPVITVLGAEMDFNVPGLCTYFSIGASLVLLFAAVVGMRIIGGAI